MQFSDKRGIISSFLDAKLSIRGFFIHLALLWGIFDSLRALQMYLAIPNKPVIAFSFVLTATMMFTLAGYIYSIPLYFITRSDQSENKAVSIKWATIFLLPVLLIPLVYGMVGVLIIYPTTIRAWFKILLAVVVIGVYIPALFFMGRRLFDYIRKGGVSLYYLLLLEFAFGMIGYMVVTGLNYGNLIIRFASGVILVLFAAFLLRSRLSPIYNRLTNYLFRIAAAIIIIIPIVTSNLPETAPSRSKTTGGTGNIIVITIDALRTDYLTAYGSKWTSTPNLDKFAEDSVVFDKMYSISPWTLPSMSSLMTGLYPMVHGANIRTLQIHKDIPTLAENLRDEGYATAAFLINPVIGIPSRINKGFDTFHESFSPNSPYEHLIPYSTWHQVFFTGSCKSGRTHFDGYFVENMESNLFSWIEKHKDEKVFLWVHYFDPHVPYQPPERYRKRENPQGDDSYDYIDYEQIMELELGIGRVPEETMNTLKDLYAGEIEYCDERVGVLFDKIKEAGWDNATMIVSSDHGEEFGDHDGFDHGHAFYQEIMHVPLIIKTGAGVEPVPSDREREPINMLDLSATIADMAGIGHKPFASKFQGTSIYDDSPEAETTPVTFMEELNRGYPHRIAVSYNGFKIILHDNDEIREVYDLNHDPDETMNILIDCSDEFLDEVSNAVAEWRSTNKLLRKSLRSDPDKEDEKAKTNRNMLKGLGYF